jgi:hypothetical protein
LGGEENQSWQNRKANKNNPASTAWIDDFFAEYPPAPGGSDKVDTKEADEVIEAIAKSVAELTSRQDGIFRKHLVERLMLEIIKFDGEFRREDAAGTIGSNARHSPASHALAHAR